MKLNNRLAFKSAIVILSSCLLFLSLGIGGCANTSGSGDTMTEEGYGRIGSDGTRAFSDQDLALEAANRFGDGAIPEAKAGGLFEDIFFDYDSSSVRPEYHQMLQENAKVIQADPSLHAEIEGHCDKRGTNEYNLALGERRAKSIAALLTSYGASASQLSTISYGEEIPLDPGESEAAFAKNRRVHFALSRRQRGN